MEAREFCRGCDWYYDPYVHGNRQCISTAWDLGLCEEEEPGDERCYRHDEWLEAQSEEIEDEEE